MWRKLSMMMRFSEHGDRAGSLTFCSFCLFTVVWAGPDEDSF